MATHHVLIDACVAAAHFAPKTTQSANLRTRASRLLTGHAADYQVRLTIPDFCIAEVFAVFEKYRWGRTWNKQVKAKNCLTPSEFQTAREDFRGAIHNGARILQQPLSRYHILAVDLIAPVNNAYQIQRRRGKKAKNLNARPASTYDMLVVAMGIWMQRQMGADSFTVITGDDRIRQVVERAKSLKLGQPMKAHLSAVAENLGLAHGPDLYPHVLNLTNCSAVALRERLPGWHPDW